MAATGPVERVCEGSSEQPGRWCGARALRLVTGRDARGGPGNGSQGRRPVGTLKVLGLPGLLQPPWQRRAARRPGVGGSGAPAPGSPPLSAHHCDMRAGSPSTAEFTPNLSRQPPARTPTLREGSLSCPSGGQFFGRQGPPPKSHQRQEEMPYNHAPEGSSYQQPSLSQFLEFHCKGAQIEKPAGVSTCPSPHPGWQARASDRALGRWVPWLSLLSEALATHQHVPSALCQVPGL